MTYEGCFGCDHINSDLNTCAAFPKRIPLSIVSGEIEHTEPTRGQENDIVFQTISEDKKEEVQKAINNGSDRSKSVSKSNNSN